MELKTDGTAFPNNDRPRLVKNSFFSWNLTKCLPKEPEICLTFPRQFVFHDSFLSLEAGFSFRDVKICCRLIAFAVWINKCESLVTIFTSLSLSRKSIERCKMSLGLDGEIRTAGGRGISQSDSRIYDSGPLRCLRKKWYTMQIVDITLFSLLK